MLTRNGFVDIQVNGILGTDFGDGRLTLDAARNATRELVRRGTVVFCPTVVTASEETYSRVLPLLADLMDDPEVGGHVAGIHLEGPFISPVPGPRGAHQERFVRLPSIELFDRMMDWARGRVAILTVAPEMPGALELICHAVSRGVIVALGHHYADGDTLQAAVEVGARLATHVGNGITAQIDRHNNPIWWQLACDELYCSFITDGHHLPAPFIKTALRAKTPERTIIISDAVMLAGCPPGVYDFFGTEVELADSGRLFIRDTGYLAGSSSTMFECMNHLASLGLLTEDDLWKVGRSNPLTLLGRCEADVARLAGPCVSLENGRFVLKEVSISG
ncbi:MAG: N-acetylglucosamine-6-phosphate deacetylase [Armatimonadota bacterium]